MRHIHGYAARIGGIIITHKPGLHPGENMNLDNHEPHNCGLCNEVCWMSPNAMLLHVANPEFPIVCCGCGNLAEELLRAVIPNAEFMRRPVPDLADASRLN